MWINTSLQSNPCQGGTISGSLNSYASKATAAWCSTTNTPCDSGCEPYTLGGSNPQFVSPGTCISQCTSNQQMVWDGLLSIENHPPHEAFPLSFC